MSHYVRSKRKMSDDTQAKMHEANQTQIWRARCWNCRTWNSAPRAELCTCVSCGVNLWKRDEAR